MKKLLLFLVAFLAISFSGKAFADLSTSDIYELNNATPGTAKINGGKGLGTMLAGSRMTGVFGSKNDGIGNIDSNSPNTTLSSYKIINWTVPTTNYSFVLPNGQSGQTLIILKANTGSTAGKISPTTKTGFTDITLTNQGDGVVLEWHDSTGWLPNSTFGSATQGKINP